MSIQKDFAEDSDCPNQPLAADANFAGSSSASHPTDRPASPPMLHRQNAAASSSSSSSTATATASPTTASSSPSQGPSPSGHIAKRVTGTASARPAVHLSLLLPKPYESSRVLPSSSQRVFHEDQPYLALPSPISPSSSSGSIHSSYDCGNSLLPCPPTSPSARSKGFLMKDFPRRSEILSFVPRPIQRVALWAVTLPRRIFGGGRHVPVTTAGSSRGTGTGSASSNPVPWVLLYFTLNLSLTLYNKYVLLHFPFPYTMTALHALCGTIGSFVLLHTGITDSGASPPPSSVVEEKSGNLPEGVQVAKQNPKGSGVPNLTLKETLVVVMFSMLYTVNIVVSNASLKLVTVPFHQVVRGSTPLFTIALSAILFKKRSSRAKVFSLIPVIIGVGFATYGDYYCTLFGFLLTLLGTVLASFKTVVTNLFLSSPSPSALTQSPDPYSPKHRKVPSVFQYHHAPAYLTAARLPTNPLRRVLLALTTFLRTLPRLSLTPLQLLYLMSPLAFIQSTMMAHFSGELARVNKHMSVPSAEHHVHSGGFFGWLGLGGAMPSAWLVMNGVMALALNVVSFYANKKIGPVGMSVAANVKQVLTVLCAVVMFNLTITPANGLGIALTLLGGAWYARIEFLEKAAQSRREKQRSG